jgi:hypothetical protein
MPDPVATPFDCAGGRRAPASQFSGDALAQSGQDGSLRLAPQADRRCTSIQKSPTSVSGGLSSVLGSLLSSSVRDRVARTHAAGGCSSQRRHPKVVSSDVSVLGSSIALVQARVIGSQRGSFGVLRRTFEPVATYAEQTRGELLDVSASTPPDGALGR